MTTLPQDPIERYSAIREILRRLTAEERHAARRQARETIIRTFGERPTFEQYVRRDVGEYPPWLTYLVAILMMIVLFAAGNVTIFRVFTAGRDRFAETIGIEWQAALAGIAIFLLAEVTVIVSILVYRVLFKGRRGYMMAVPVTFGLLMAFVGNWVIAQPYDFWGWLETVVPPIAVLFMSLIGEQLALRAIGHRHEAQRNWQAALEDYEQDVANVEFHDAWQGTYANALREKLIEVNSRGRGRDERVEVLQALTRADWSALVYEEMHADEWYDEREALVTNPTEPRPAPMEADGRGMQLRPQSAPSPASKQETS